ncbi:hypothetical protein MNBD_GAMMA17-1698 [hydrothermal vent metagenome]|uniref:Uncharacterized protein n=1 Tax=hydrothermal vent metagenome TaxID=652676 RepID=A0A3B0ZIQ7_9ZZZZ
MTFSFFLAIAVAMAFIAWVLLLILGLSTMRKLKKNPRTIDQLGINLIWGWQTINVAQAVTLPRSWMQKLRNRVDGSKFANHELLYTHTTIFDRILLRFFFITFSFSGVSIVLLTTLDYFFDVN